MRKWFWGKKPSLSSKVLDYCHIHSSAYMEEKGNNKLSGSQELVSNVQHRCALLLVADLERLCCPNCQFPGCGHREDAVGSYSPVHQIASSSLWLRGCIIFSSAQPGNSEWTKLWCFFTPSESGVTSIYWQSGLPGSAFGGAPLLEICVAYDYKK